MGNSAKANGCQFQTDPARPYVGTNGILAHINGVVISNVLRTLPPPAMQGEETQAVFEVERFGPVRFFAKVHRAKRGKHSHLFWSIYRADAEVSDDSP